jgi:hypothetical protein
MCCTYVASTRNRIQRYLIQLTCCCHWLGLKEEPKPPPGVLDAAPPNAGAGADAGAAPKAGAAGAAPKAGAAGAAPKAGAAGAAPNTKGAVPAEEGGPGGAGSPGPGALLLEACMAAPSAMCCANSAWQLFLKLVV